MEAVQTAGPDALSEGVRPRAHGTRGRGTSWAFFHGVALHVIMKAALWFSPNAFVSYYLRSFLRVRSVFATASLGAAFFCLVHR